MIQFLDPCLNVDWQPAIQVSQCVPDGWRELLRIAVRTHHHPCLTRGRLQEWEKHCRLRVFSKAVIFSLFRNAHHLDARSILSLEISANRVGYRAKDFARELHVDHRYARSIFIVMPCEASSGQQDSARRVEIFGRYLVQEDLSSGIRWPQVCRFVRKDKVA